MHGSFSQGDGQAFMGRSTVLGILQNVGPKLKKFKRITNSQLPLMRRSIEEGEKDNKYIYVQFPTAGNSGYLFLGYHCKSLLGVAFPMKSPSEVSKRLGSKQREI
ncbi:hypothetical protein VNO77_07329 [Canavalia gladiata]|uniref:Uncharacterized protein n=1 Tax=Canavalia gladiata TaxID=3824 RepID=A0AAN9M926_CANGL